MVDDRLGEDRAAGCQRDADLEQEAQREPVGTRQAVARAVGVRCQAREERQGDVGGDHAGALGHFVGGGVDARRGGAGQARQHQAVDLEEETLAAAG